MKIKIGSKAPKIKIGSKAPKIQDKTIYLKKRKGANNKKIA